MKNNLGIILQSIITCPKCGHKKKETMSTNSCQIFYECKKCKMELKPKKGDCCVFCSYGTIKCPPIQKGTSCWKKKRRKGCIRKRFWIIIIVLCKSS
mgnify:CR=1 FL=1